MSIGDWWDEVVDFFSFDNLSDSFSDFNVTALFIAVCFSAGLYWMMFSKTLAVAGWSNIPVVWRIITLVLSLPVFYWVANYKLNN